MQRGQLFGGMPLPAVINHVMAFHEFHDDNVVITEFDFRHRQAGTFFQEAQHPGFDFHAALGHFGDTRAATLQQQAVNLRVIRRRQGGDRNNAAAHRLFDFFLKLRRDHSAKVPLIFSKMARAPLSTIA